MLTIAYATGTTTEILPSKGIHAECIYCGEEVISKCGPINEDHFAHIPSAECDTRRFHDNKTLWHIRWQRTVDPLLPGVNIEVPIVIDGELKRADLISKSNYIIEFQHSHLPIDERINREKHYKNIIWVVHTDRRNSKTWKHPTFGVRTFFNGDDNVIRWGSFTISKERFIKTVINNPHYEDSIINTIELRQRIHANATIEYYNRKSDERNPTPYLIRSDYYAVLLYIIREFSAVEKYHAKLEADRLEAKRQAEEAAFIQAKQIREAEYSRRMRIKEATAALLKEQRQMRDPALLQALLKSEREITDTYFITERNEWVQSTEQELLSRNRVLYEARLKLEHERELEIAKQINTEITIKHTHQLTKETQERIRIDLIRANGKLEYAAEIARKKLTQLGIDYNDEATRAAYGVGTQ